MYDDTKLKDSISDLEARVTKLETLCNQMNSNISALQAVVVALQNKEYIESIKPLPDNQGYSFSFSSGRFVTVYNGKDGVAPAIGVRQDTDGVWYWTLNGDWLYTDGTKVKAVGADGKDGSDGKDGVAPKLKIEDGMWYMSCDGGCSWELLGKATGDDGADAEILTVTEDGSYVHFGMADGTVITIAKRMPLTISFDSEDVAITTGGASKTISYTLTGASEKVVVKTLAQDGWRAKVNQVSSLSGSIEITAPNPLVESEILVFVSDGGQTALAAINCVKATIVISQEKYEVDAAGGNIDVTAQTNTDFQVSIPNDAKSWLSYISTKSMATKTFNLSAAANDNAFRRNAVVSLTDESGNVIRSFVVSQAGDMRGLVSIQCDVKGDLHSILEAYDKENIVKMKISGVLNDVDFLDIYYEMPALRYLDISDVNIDSLPNDCFKYSRNVTTIILPKLLKSIPNDCFFNSNVSGDLLIPASCETIGTSAFKNCKLLERVTFESGSHLKKLRGAGNRNDYYGVFSDCVALKSITIPSSCESIGYSTFINCKSLESVVFESGSCLKIIDGQSEYYGTYYGAFENCTSLKSITIPATCETIAPSAFKGCKSLESVIFLSGSQLKTIGGHNNYGAFSDCAALKSIVLPSSCETIEASAFKNCISLESVVFEPDSKLKKIGGGYSIIKTDTPAFPSNDGNYYVSIPYGAFSGCSALKSITIPATCETIESTAFKGCTSLEQVVFMDGSKLGVLCGGVADSVRNRRFESSDYIINGVGYISHGIFAKCSSLKSIEIPASVVTIEDGCFAGCTSLADVSFSGVALLSTIGKHSFAHCELHRVDMRDCLSLDNIGDYAFMDNNRIYFFLVGAVVPPRLGKKVFGSVGIYSVLKVPSGSEYSYSGALGWNEFSSITAID